MIAFDSTWPEPTLTSREKSRLAELAERPDVEARIRTVHGLPAGHRFRQEAPMRIVVMPAPSECVQVESRVYPGGEIDRTHPTAYDATSRCAPGPQLNIYPRVQRSAFRQLLRALRGR